MDMGVCVLHPPRALKPYFNIQGPITHAGNDAAKKITTLESDKEMRINK